MLERFSTDDNREQYEAFGVYMKDIRVHASSWVQLGISLE